MGQTFTDKNCDLPVAHALARGREPLPGGHPPTDSRLPGSPHAAGRVTTPGPGATRQLMDHQSRPSRRRRYWKGLKETFSQCRDAQGGGRAQGVAVGVILVLHHHLAVGARPAGQVDEAHHIVQPLRFRHDRPRRPHLPRCGRGYASHFRLSAGFIGLASATRPCKSGAHRTSRHP